MVRRYLPVAAFAGLLVASSLRPGLPTPLHLTQLTMTRTTR